MHRIHEWSSIIAASNFVTYDKDVSPNAENISYDVLHKVI